MPLEEAEESKLYLDSEHVDFHAEEDNEGEEARPLLFVDINLGEDQVERIVVYEGNTASQLAKEFSNKHGKFKQ